MSRQFNDVVCVDHMFLEENRVFHIMDSSTRSSVGSCVPDTKMIHSIQAFDSRWLSSFWPPGSVLYDPAFDNTEFEAFLKQHDICSTPLARPRSIPLSTRYRVRVYDTFTHDVVEADMRTDMIP